MLTPDDIKLLIQAEKEVFYTKTEFDEKFNKLEHSFSSLQTSVDGLATVFKKYHDEQQIMVHQVKHMEDWIKKASIKLGVDYNP